MDKTNNNNIIQPKTTLSEAQIKDFLINYVSEYTNKIDTFMQDDNLTEEQKVLQLSKLFVIFYYEVVNLSVLEFIEKYKTKEK